MKKLAAAPIKDNRGRLRLDWLRDKVAARSLVHMGWHPMDCHRAKWSKCKEVADDNCKAIQIDGKATKRPGQKVRNYWACGCTGMHDPENENCDYGLVTLLVRSLGEDRAN